MKSKSSCLQSRQSSIPAFGNEDREVHWFPLRVAYDRVLDVKRELEVLGIDHFLPLDEIVKPHPDGYKVIESPKLGNLIFVRTTKENLTIKKHSNRKCRYLRFITYIPQSVQHEKMTRMERLSANRIIVIPDCEMHSFMQAVNLSCVSVEIIPYSETFNHIGRKIRILQGPLAGSVGVLRRIKNNKRVHIDCGGLLTAELGYMPKDKYELLSND